MDLEKYVTRNLTAFFRHKFVFKELSVFANWRLACNMTAFIPRNELLLIMSKQRLGLAPVTACLEHQGKEILH